MLLQEAKWFARQIAGMDDASIFPMLNIGSHTEEFRRKQQPWIDKYIFGPARARGQVVKHSDIRAALGVDIVGDLADPAFLDQLHAMRFRSVFCSNLLEHVENREEIGRVLAGIVPTGAYLFVSCPHEFPYHPDPIDTMYRPGPAELASLFPGTCIRREEVLPCGTLVGYIAGRISGSPLAFARSLFRNGAEPSKRSRLLERGDDAKRREPSRVRVLAPYLFKGFRETCLVLQKVSCDA
jgi:hypothetical protein